jgi:hypothetical protein
MVGVDCGKLRLIRVGDAGTGNPVLQEEASSVFVPLLKKFADTLEEHQEGILHYYDYPISTATCSQINTTGAGSRTMRAGRGMYPETTKKHGYGVYLRSFQARFA